MMHNNLFSQGHTRRDVKGSLSQNQKRNNTALQVLDLVVGACLIYLLRNQPILDAAAIFIGSFAALSGIRYFVDQSNRNFYLHRLDWNDAGPDDADG